jgi:hypothetical protein
MRQKFMFVDRRMFLLYFWSAKKNPTVIFYTEGKNYEGCRTLHNFAKKEPSGSLLPDGKKYAEKFGLQHRRTEAKKTKKRIFGGSKTFA